MDRRCCERAASVGKLCIWVEGSGGHLVPRPDQFDSLEHAIAVAVQLAALARQVIVYDDKGDERWHWGERGGAVAAR